MAPIRCSFSLTKARCSSEELLDRLFKKGVVTEAEVTSAFSLPEWVPDWSRLLLPAYLSSAHLWETPALGLTGS